MSFGSNNNDNNKVKINIKGKAKSNINGKGCARGASLRPCPKVFVCEGDNIMKTGSGKSVFLLYKKAGFPQFYPVLQIYLTVLDEKIARRFLPKTMV